MLSRTEREPRSALRTVCRRRGCSNTVRVRYCSMCNARKLSVGGPRIVTPASAKFPRGSACADYSGQLSHTDILPNHSPARKPPGATLGMWCGPSTFYSPSSDSVQEQESRLESSARPNFSPRTRGGVALPPKPCRTQYSTFALPRACVGKSAGIVQAA